MTDAPFSLTVVSILPSLMGLF